jgi:hypothetical protein
MIQRLILMAAVLAAPAAVQADEKVVEYVVHAPGYFESNKSGLKGAESHLIFTDQKAFDSVFRSVFVPGGKAKLLPKDAFDKQMVIATIKRGMEIVEYKVEKLVADDGVLKLSYSAKGKGKGTATYASPLIVSLPKGKYTAVEFIENGKTAETVKLDK